jgi:hypothetical protein
MLANRQISGFLLVTGLAALVACGSGDGADSDLPEVSAPTPRAATGAAPGGPDLGELAAGDPTVESCLGLVRDAAYPRALPVCLEALQIDPDNEQVRAAVERAKSESARLADAAAAAQEAGGETSKAIEDASRKLPGGLSD